MFFVENLPAEERQRLIDKFGEIGSPSKRYYILAVLAIIIATFGLILDSPATVIGAMLVAPLMQPILLASIALVTARTRQLSKAIDAIVKGVVLSIIIATFISLLIPIYDMPQEVLARSQPAILDMFIALAAGAAGMYVMIKKDSVTLPGVAITVSLMPPLSVVGIGLATRNFDIAYGAGLLYITNLVAIISSGAFVLFAFGFRPYAKTKEGLFREGAIISISLLTILTVLLSSTFIQVSAAEKRKSDIKDELNRQIQAITAGQGKVQSFAIDKAGGDQITVSATILSPSNLTEKDMEILTNALAFRTELSVNLKATVIPTLIGGVALESEDIEEIKKEKERNPDLGDRAPIIATSSAELFMAPFEPFQEVDASQSAEATPSSTVKKFVMPQNSIFGVSETAEDQNLPSSTPQVQGASSSYQIFDEEF